MNSSEFQKVIRTVLFLIILCIPAILLLIGSDNENIEKRTKQSFPQLDTKDLKGFVSDFEDYYSDNFGGRTFLLKAYNKFKYHIFKTSPDPDAVIIGKDGWLFLGNKFSQIIDETSGRVTFQEPVINKISKNIKAQKSWLESKNIKHYLCIAPNKHSVYSEKLPKQVKYQKQLTKLESIKKKLSAENIEIIDLKDHFNDYKPSQRLYHKTNSHWNDYGAYIASNQLLTRIKQDFPELKIHPITDYRKEIIITKDEDLGQIVTSGLEEERIVLLPQFEKTADLIDDRHDIPKNYRKSPAAYEYRYSSDKKLKVMILRDSFTTMMVNFLVESFGESVFIWDHTFDKELIESENPDIVVQILVEREVDILASKIAWQYE